MSTPGSNIREALTTSNRTRNLSGSLFHGTCIATTVLALAALGILLVGVGWQSIGWLDWQFLSSPDSRIPERAGVLAAMWGTLWLMVFTALISIPLGVGAAIFLEEYATNAWYTKFIRLNLSNLAGVPSIVYGILGLSVFVRNFGIFGSRPETYEIAWLGGMKYSLPFGPCILTGALTLSMLVLPTVIIATQEALRAVPQTLRHASLALGATQWQTVWRQVLPAATPGIVTGVILALSRAIGETAPLVMLGIPLYWAYTPGRIEGLVDVVTSPGKMLDVPFGRFTSMPLVIYNWVSRPQPKFRNVASAGIVVLLVLLTAMNLCAIIIRTRSQQRIRW